MNGRNRASEPRLVKTGVPGLDDLLIGGLMEGAYVVVEGVPGAGKTTLGLQFIHAGITQFDEPGLVFSFEEFPEELYRDGAAYGWDLRALEQDGKLGVICTSPEVFSEDTMAPDGLFESLVAEVQPKRVLVDSITQMEHVTADPRELRRLIYSLRNGFKRHNLTVMLTAEVQSADGSVPFERYIADTVILLDQRLIPESGERTREIEVTKTRSRPHVSGRHLAEVDETGMRVLPHVATRGGASAEAVTPEIEFVSTDSEGLDGMLGGGLVRGSTTIAAGSTGVGKTILGLQYLFAGARQGETGLIVSFEQTEGELRRIAKSLGLPAEQISDDGPIQVLYAEIGRAPLGLIVSQVDGAVRERRPDRVVLDAISTLARAPGETSHIRADIAGLVSVLRASPATTIICDETPGIVGEFEVTGGVMISSLADNIIIMRYVELGSEMRRAVSILKARYVDHDKEIREYIIGQGGLELKEKFEVTTGLLKGAPVRREVDDFF